MAALTLVSEESPGFMERRRRITSGGAAREGFSTASATESKPLDAHVLQNRNARKRMKAEQNQSSKGERVG